MKPGQELEQKRLHAKPPLPLLLQDLTSLQWIKSSTPSVSPPIAERFALTCKQAVLQACLGEKRSAKLFNVGVVFSGGPAPGGHDVICGLLDALKHLHKGSRLFGFLNGPEGILNGNYQELTKEGIAPYRNTGGFDLIGTGRTKIQTEDQLAQAMKVMQDAKFHGLVIVGGDDSNTNAAILAEYFLAKGCATQVIGVPKTIDGDLQNPYVPISFGFDTACRTYSELIGNLARDAKSAKKYTHFIRLMGRTASHITLECALATHPNLALIAEEIAAEKKTLKQIIQEIADLIGKRSHAGKNYGVILIPEGLIEFIPEMAQLIKELNKLLSDQIPQEQISSQLTESSQSAFCLLPKDIQKQLLMSRDPHGNVQVSFIETEKLIMELVGEELQHRKMDKYAPLSHFFGYEGRAAYPTPFDSTYCLALGAVAASLITEGATGYMACVTHLTDPVEKWGIAAVPLTMLMHMQVRKGKEMPVIQKTLVDLNGKPFKTFQSLRSSWALEDNYVYPGPIQFSGEILHVPQCIQ